MVVASVPRNTMNAFEMEESFAATVKESYARICSHRFRGHFSTVAGLVITGALVVYMTSLHMGSLSSEEAALLSAAPNANAPRTSPGSATESLQANSSAQSPLSDVAANASIPVASPQSALSNHTASARSDGAANASIPAASPQAPGETIAAGVYFQNMSETWHTMSDATLLKKATATVAPRPEGASGESKLAYMFMARGVLPFAPLWERYFRGHAHLFSIYIHAHPHYVPSVDPSSPFFRRFVPSQVVQWGKLSVYEAERRLIGNALLDAANEWFLLLSESCIPIYSFPDTYDYFNQSRGVSFIESYPDITRRLYRQNHEAMSPEITGHNFRKGSQWFQITRELAAYAARDSKEYAKFEKYFCQLRPTCYIDEHCLHTLAWIQSPRNLAFRTLTYFDFRGKSAHPKKFAARDTDASLLLGIRTGHNCTFNAQSSSQCYLFARKFSPEALPNLLDLAAPVMGIP